MPSTPPTTAFTDLARRFTGEVHTDDLWRFLYATDGSVYKQQPAAVVVPRTEEDLRRTLAFAREHGLPLIPRAGGTSLAGQVVGEGIVLDMGKYFNRILEVNAEAGWVRLQPGVIRDELNVHLRPHGRFFGPNTSTANRCMLGGMVGNNSCGSTSIVYGSTRDHVRSLRTLLSDGSEAVFQSLSPEAFHDKRQHRNLEGRVYEQLYTALSDPERQRRIRAEYPKPTIRRRNTGYAIDLLLHSNIFTEGGPDFNLCTLLCGSEGTLALTTEIELHIDPLPAPEVVVLCAHFRSISECMHGVLTAMARRPTACELMDRTILDLTKQNREQQKNRFFLDGDPAAVLMIEFRGESRAEVEHLARQLVADYQAAGQGYAFPLVFGANTERVWALRAAGLGVLANLPGDAKSVPCIEDTAVEISDLPAYIDEFQAMMADYGQQPIYYAHAGDGEIHLRPVLNLKEQRGQELLYEITESVARLVKRYGGSLSGEHGDGRVRAPFLPMMIGEDNYELLREIKRTWDPDGVFNPGKIVDAPPMNENLRYRAGQATPDYDTAFDFSDVGGILRMAEKCNGSGDCRKLAFSGGVMCPSYRATRNERDVTRGRANVLREVLTMNVHDNPFDHPALHEAMDLCLSCKGCTAECPSNVDVATLKAEYQYQVYKKKGVPWRSRVFADISRLNRLAGHTTRLSNLVMRGRLTSGPLKKLLGVAPQRSLPPLSRTTLRRWWLQTGRHQQPTSEIVGRVFFFVDEFTNYNDAEVGSSAITLLQRLGYEVLLPQHADSGRAHISKGLLDQAREMAAANVATFYPLATVDTPLIGCEPSAILGFRDEYPRLLRGRAQEQARTLASHVMLFEEFFTREVQQGRIREDDFTTCKKQVLLHGHCHQKALANTEVSAFALSVPVNYTVTPIPSGCCGMAGSFGYEAEHYDVSMKIGEETLFPAVRATAADTIIAAPGTSCRHQILDGTGRRARHPAEVLLDALSLTV